MKKLITLLLILAMLPVIALADLPDISGLSFDELVQLKDQINLAIWNSQEWQEVTVPAGVWIVGIDIPAGYWEINAIGEDYLYCTYFNELNDLGDGPALGSVGRVDMISTRKNKDGTWQNNEAHVLYLDMKEGMYFKCSHDVVFSPYTGKPDLGFN